MPASRAATHSLISSQADDDAGISRRFGMSTILNFIIDYAFTATLRQSIRDETPLSNDTTSMPRRLPRELL
jgi:hypothetical protein